MRIYSLENISPEERAVVYSKGSRSLYSYEKIAERVAPDDTAEFLKRWVVKEKHFSIAEHIPLSFVLEDIPYAAATFFEKFSNVATLARSSRHQQVPKKYYLPPQESEIAKNKELYDFFISTMEFLFTEYEKALKNGASFETVRTLLPLGTLTSLALTTNAGTLLRVLQEGANFPLRAVREVCEELRKAAANIAPIIFSSFKIDERGIAHMKSLSEAREGAEGAERARISAEGGKSEAEIGVPVPSQGEPSTSFHGASQSARHTFYTFNLLLDFPTLRDLLHTRRGVVSVDPYTIEYGFGGSDPFAPQQDLLRGSDPYEPALLKAKSAVEKISEKHPHAAQYLISFAFRQRVLLTISLQDIMEVSHHLEPEEDSPAFIALWRGLQEKIKL